MDDGTRHSTDLAHDYDRKAEAIERITSSAGPQDWERPSPCQGWSARDVIDHLVDTQRDFLSQQGLLLPESQPAERVGETAQVKVSAAGQRWQSHTHAVAALLADPRVGGTAYEGFFGPTTVGETLAQFYGWDMLVHRWDLGRALGAEVTFTERELDEIEAPLPMFGDQLYAEGICGPAIQVGADEPRQVQVLARLGRAAQQGEQP